MHRFITISILQIANVAFVNQKTTNFPDARIPFGVMLDTFWDNFEVDFLNFLIFPKHICCLLWQSIKSGGRYFCFRFIGV